MKYRALSIVLLLFASLGVQIAPSFGQSKMDEATAQAATFTGGDKPQSSPSPTGTVVTAMPAAPGSVVLDDPAARKSYLDAMQRYYEYRASGYDYRSRVFEWQLFSSYVIFAVVLLLVGSGVYFAGVQFRDARAAARAASLAGTPAEPSIGALATQLELSAKGITVNSSVMGVIILALSLAFFYLYLVYVYPVSEVF